MSHDLCFFLLNLHDQFLHEGNPQKLTALLGISMVCTSAECILIVVPLKM